MVGPGTAVVAPWLWAGIVSLREVAGPRHRDRDGIKVLGEFMSDDSEAELRKSCHQSSGHDLPPLPGMRPPAWRRWLFSFVNFLHFDDLISAPLAGPYTVIEPRLIVCI